jgi:hypothetical protein
MIGYYLEGEYPKSPGVCEPKELFFDLVGLRRSLIESLNRFYLMHLKDFYIWLIDKVIHEYLEQ